MNYDIFIDPRNGRSYKTVQIGTQIWMAENLNFDDGKRYKNKLYTTKYGRLYDWETAHKICPKGWHLPSNEEWQTLVVFAGGTKIAGQKLKAKMYWEKNGNGTDNYGFCGLPGGCCLGDDDIVYIGYYANWWAASEFRSDLGHNWSMSHCNDKFYCYQDSKANSLSVRCIKD